MTPSLPRSRGSGLVVGFTMTDRVLDSAYDPLRVDNPPGNPIHNCGAQHLGVIWITCWDVLPLKRDYEAGHPGSASMGRYASH